MGAGRLGRTLRLPAQSLLCGAGFPPAAHSFSRRQLAHRRFRRHTAFKEPDECGRCCATDCARAARSACVLDLGRESRGRRRDRAGLHRRDVQRTAARQNRTERLAVLAEVPANHRTYAPAAAAKLHGILNMVTADGVAEGVPSVVSPAIDWAPADWKAEPDNVGDIARVGRRLLLDPYAAEDGLRALEAYVCDGLRAYRAYLSRWHGDMSAEVKA